MMSTSETKTELYVNSSREILQPDEYDNTIQSMSRQDQEPPTGTVYLDCLRGSKGRTTIVNRATEEVLYTITNSSSLLSLAGSKTTFVRGVTEDPDSHDAGKPYAELGVSTLRITEHPEEESLQKMRNGKLLYSDGFLKVADKISVYGVEYLLKVNPLALNHTEVQLVPALSPDQTPLVTFKLDPSSTRRGGEIVVSPSAISSGPKPLPNALLHDGKPTWLLDTALVAQAIYRTELLQTPAGPSVTGGKGGAAMERAGETIFRMGW